MSTLADTELPTEFDVSFLDPEVPAEIAGALVAMVPATLCILALVRSLAFDEATPRWLLVALIEHLERDARAYVRLLASIPGIDVPSSVIPIEERIDLAALEERHKKARAAARRTLDEERQSRAR